MIAAELGEGDGRKRLVPYHGVPMGEGPTGMLLGCFPFHRGFELLSRRRRPADPGLIGPGLQDGVCFVW